MNKRMDRQDIPKYPTSTLFREQGGMEEGQQEKMGGGVWTEKGERQREVPVGYEQGGGREMKTVGMIQPES